MNTPTQRLVDRMERNERIAFEAGRVGFSHGMAITDSPYTTDTHEFDCWALGYFTERTEREQRSQKAREQAT